MSETFTKLGVRYRHYRAHGGRFGPGKVHLQVWLREQRRWASVCRLTTDPFAGYYGDSVELARPVTCKKCLRHPAAVR